MLEIYISNNIRSIIMINDKHLDIFANIYLRINSMLSWGGKDKCKLSGDFLFQKTLCSLGIRCGSIRLTV